MNGNSKKFYGVFDAAGMPQGFYVDDIYPPQEDGSLNAAIPDKAVEITEADWQELLSHPATARYRDSTITRIELPPPPPLVDPVAELTKALQEAMTRIEALEAK